MSTAMFDEALRIIDLLDVDERRLLLAQLAAKIDRQPIQKHSVLEFRGVGKHNPVGMDAQEYINRERDSWNG